jgi:transposase-like protein
MASVLSAPHFHNEEAAFEYVEAHLWPNGPVCPHCGMTEGKIGRLTGKTARPGLRKCYACRKQFTVRIGTIFEDSHAPMKLWLQAIHLMCAAKKGISTRQLQRMLGVGMKTAWFMGHRIREAMKPSSNFGQIGGAGKTVEADETVLGRSHKSRRPNPERPNVQVFSLVERGGAVRSMVLDHRNVRSALHEHLDFDSRLVTDGAQHYKNMLKVGQHESVDHSKYEWARGDVHTNTLEGFLELAQVV